ncbi:hypothetical protein ACJBV1_11260, partial [Streptococcus suis]
LDFAGLVNQTANNEENHRGEEEAKYRVADQAQQVERNGACTCKIHQPLAADLDDQHEATQFCDFHETNRREVAE